MLMRRCRLLGPILPRLLVALLLASTAALLPGAAGDAAEAADKGHAGGEAAQGNGTNKENSLADMIDRALEKEFPDSKGDQGGGETDRGSFNNTFIPLKEVFLDRSEQEDVPTLIDRKDNVLLYQTEVKVPVLQLDLTLISDLVVVIVSATCGGIAFACLGQPVITGYLLAGSIIGPGGFSFLSLRDISPFALGLEFSTAKLRAVRAVAVLGGLLQIILFMFLCGISATLCGGKTKEGVFMLLLSMSSTAVVLKFLMEKNSINALHGQVTVGIPDCRYARRRCDCVVGLLFALLPILSGSGLLSWSCANDKIVSAVAVLVLLISFLGILYPLRICVPWFLLMISLSSQCSDKLGLSLELGSFAAGVMISTTDLITYLEQVIPSVILVITIKTFIVSIVVKGFGYNNKTSLLVGMSLAQSGEFAFVILSRASSIHLIEGKLYLLLLGTTALSLVTTPLLFKMIPAVVHLGVLLRWFSVDSNQVELGLKGEVLRIDSGKRINLIIQGPHDS
ncbi:hypothetical protein ZWY2020_054734 [Hordeum vulgare]|nr:hypothetical protein ZWY2020_054734 [Hordeum vulgare]